MALVYLCYYSLALISTMEKTLRFCKWDFAIWDFRRGAIN